METLLLKAAVQFAGVIVHAGLYAAAGCGIALYEWFTGKEY